MGMFDDLVPGQQSSGMFDDLMPKDYGIDFTQPVETVRVAIDKLPETDRKSALDQWAKSYVERENKLGGIGQSIDNTVRTLARGSIIGEGLDEISAAASSGLHSLTGGRIGAPYEETLAYQRARDKYIDEQYPAASIAGRIAGGLASGGAALKAYQGTDKAQKLVGAILGGPVPTQPSRLTPYIGRTGGMFAQAAPYAVGYGITARALGGEGDTVAEGARNRLDSAFDADRIGQDLAAAGFFTGGARSVEALAEPVARALGPTYERYVAPTVRSVIPQERRMASGGAAAPQDFGPMRPPDPEGAERSALSIIGQQLTRAGVTPEQLAGRLDNLSDTRRFWSNSYADDAVALADIDPSLQRLAGAAARQQPEAYNIAERFIKTRQTGFADPQFADDLTARGLKIKPQFDTENTGATAGQFDRIQDAFKRAYGLNDEAFHGHQRNGYQTALRISANQKAKADETYDAAMKLAENVDVRAYLAPTFKSILDDISNMTDSFRGPAQRMIKRLMSAKTLKEFDREKRVADSVIGRYFNKASDRMAPTIGQELNGLKNRILSALDDHPSFGESYANARKAWQSDQEFIEALQSGRNAFKVGERQALEDYAMLGKKPGMDVADKKRLDNLQKLYRLGTLDALYEKRPAVGRDVTKIFEDPKTARIMSGIFKSRKGEFSPQRQGQRLEGILRDESLGIETRNKVLGGSPTARNLQDDAQLQFMQEIEEVMNTARSSQPITAFIERQVTRMIERLFGFRADTAASIADKLFNADPMVRQLTVMQLREFMGTERMELFRQFMAGLNQRVSRAAATTAGGMEGNE